MGRNNAFALPPQLSNLGPLTDGPITCQPSHSSCHVAPPGNPRGLTWPCHAFASHPHHASEHLSARVGSRGIAMWPCMPCRIHVGPMLRHIDPRLLRRKYPLFAIFKGIKIKINSRKIQKIHKSICLKI